MCWPGTSCITCSMTDCQSVNICKYHIGLETPIRTFHCPMFFIKWYLHPVSKFFRNTKSSSFPPFQKVCAKNTQSWNEASMVSERAPLILQVLVRPPDTSSWPPSFCALPNMWKYMHISGFEDWSHQTWVMSKSHAFGGAQKKLSCVHSLKAIKTKKKKSPDVKLAVNHIQIYA